MRYRSTAAIAPYRRYYESVHFVPGLDWEEDPELTRTFLTLGRLDIFWPNKRASVTSAKDANPGPNRKIWPVFCDHYMECTGWWPPGEAAQAPRDWAPAPPQAVHVRLSRADLHLKEGLETVAGCRCAVVSDPDGLDTLWFDVDRGCALVQRHMADHKNHLHGCYTNSSFREVAPGVWLPWEVRRVIHRGRSPGENPDDHQVLFSATRRISKLRVNDVADETFIFRPPPGTGISDQDRKDNDFVTPGGIDFLDQTVRSSQKILRVHAAQSPPHDEKGGVAWSAAGILAGAAVGIVVWLAIRRYRGQARRMSMAPGPGSAVASGGHPG